MRSVVVVLPASMCAMMPIFRVRSSGACLAIDVLLLSAISYRLSAISSQKLKCNAFALADS
jgi:hypothetical protein